MSRLPPAAALLAAQAVEVAAQFAAGILAARGLGPDGLGELIHALALAGVLAVFLLFGTGDVALTLYVERRVAPAALLTASLRVLRRGVVICLLLAATYAALAGRDPAPILLAQAALALNGLGSVFNQAVIGRRIAAFDLPGVLLSRAALVGWVWFAAQPGGLLAVLSGHLVAGALLVVSRARVVHRHGFTLRWRPDAELDATLRRRGRHIGIGAVFGSLSARADALLLRGLAGASATGLYGAAARLLNGVYAGATALALALYLRFVAGCPRARRRFVGLPVLASGALFAAAWLVPEVVVWLHGPAFGEAVPVMRALFVAGALQVPLVFATKALVASAREAVLARAQAVQAGVNVGLNLLLIPLAGAEGAAWATVVADAVLAAQIAWAFRPGTRSGVRPVLERPDVPGTPETPAVPLARALQTR